jgi:hypothetical protein
VACRIGGISDYGGFQVIPADSGTSLVLVPNEERPAS